LIKAEGAKFFSNFHITINLI